MYFTSGSDRAFEQLMQQRPGADHFDSGDAGAPEDCGDCRFYRPHWKYQFCVYAECPYQPGKLTALDAVKFQVKGVDDEMAVFRVEKNRGYDNVADVMPSYRKYDSRHTIVNRIKAGVCEICGEHADYLCMHHVRTLKSLKGRDIFEQKMLKMRRKSLALCPDCFELLHETKESR